MELKLDSNTIAILVGLGTVLAWIVRNSIKLGELRLKTDTMWDFLWKGAMADARLRGVVAQQSRATLSADFRNGLGPLGQTITRYYREHQLEHVPDSEVTLMLARAFGDALIEAVCVPLGINLGAALIGVLHYCREEAARVRSEA